MKISKLTIFVFVLAIAGTLLVSNLVRESSQKKEKARIEALVAPVIAASVEGTPDPKPSLSFVNVSEKSVMVVVRWEQKPEAAIKNDMRERVTTSIRRELSADPASWGRHISVIFDDEVITQGFK